MNKKMTPEELEKFIHRELRALPPRKAPAGFAARLQAAVASRTASTSGVLTSDQLEQRIHRELRALPVRKAPATLEARVLAEIERRATIAWYHKSWSYWPAAVRATFLAGATGLSVAFIYALTWVGRGSSATAVAHEVGNRFQVFSLLYSAGAWVVDFAGRLVGGIPSLWLYGGLATVFALYAACFGLGAVAYRTLYRRD